MFLGLPDQHPDPLVRGTDPRPDPYQNVTDPQHWIKGCRYEGYAAVGRVCMRPVQPLCVHGSKEHLDSAPPENKVKNQGQ